MTTSVFVGALLIGLGVGFLSGAFGKGGSAIATPMLHLLGVPAMAAIASPLPATIPSSWLASRSYARANSVDNRVVRVGLPLGLVATVAGAVLTRWIPGQPLVLFTDVVILAFGLRLLLSQRAPSPDDARATTDASGVSTTRATTTRIVAVVAVVGFVSGLLGNSGGFLLAPLFVAVLDMPIHRAFGTSLVLATCLAVPGTLVHWWLGHIDWSLTFAFGFAAVPAAFAGAQLALRTNGRSLTVAYGVALSTLAGGLLALSH